MNEHIDCALIAMDNGSHSDWMGPHLGEHGKVRVEQLVAANIPSASNEQHHILRELSMAARRFDVCIIYIDQKNLSAMRCCLAMAQATFLTPIFALVSNLNAKAINDLLQLGVSDFIRAPFNVDELRVRVHMLKRRFGVPLGVSTINEHNALSTYMSQHPSALEAGASAQEEALCASVLINSRFSLEAYVAAVAIRYERLNKPFQVAKAIVIQCYEKAYICAALSRSGGNIAMAARMANKHRRAFWALMRKYNIEADTFRSVSEPDKPVMGTLSEQF